MARPVIALLTDFGTRDHYAGVMKGVALGICPDATLVDITHDIPAHDVLAGARELAAAYTYFPAGTVFLVVVDPGVGSDRRGLAAEAGAYRFVAPDNGVLSVVFDDITPTAIVALTERRYARPMVSRTFEGRDRFAPAAAWLAQGVAVAALGPDAGPIERVEPPKPRLSGRVIAGEVVRVDRFGNLVTNIDRATFDALTGGPIDLTAGPHVIARIVSTYAEAAPGEICALFGSTEHLEIAANGASAAASLALDRGAAVQVSRRA